MARPILFLSDYGLDDEYVGVVHAVLARLAPEARVIDLAHGIPPQDVLTGAFTLAAAVPYAPPGAVFLGVVDPGVGTERRGVAIEAGDASLVGPDNGLLLEAAHSLGGPGAAVVLDELRLPPWPLSATFHGRDLFAPAAALLALGERLASLGDAVDVGSLASAPPAEVEVSSGGMASTVVGVDRFGNVRLAVRPGDLGALSVGGAEGLRVEAGAVVVRADVVRTFAEIPDGGFGALEDSAGFLAICRNGESAAEALRVRPGDRVVVGPVR